MSARPIADCEACLDALPELVCDELDSETRAAVLKHTKTCATCARQLSQFRGVMSVAEAMPYEAPSPRVREAVLLAAREAQSRKAVEAQAAREPIDSAWVRFSAWLERLGTWAMSPQVAMASVLLLMLGVGLVALPMGREPEHTALRPAQEMATQAEPAATATAAPVPAKEEATPAAAIVDPASDRGAGAIGSAQPQKAMEQDQFRASDLAAKARRNAAPAGAQPKGKVSKDEALRSRDDTLGDVTIARARPGGGAASGQAFPSALDDADRAPPAPKPADSSMREAFAVAPPPYASAQAESASPSANVSDKKTEAPPEASLLAQGIRAAQAGDARGAIAVLRPLAEKGSPSVRQSAALWLARSYRATGDCTNALRYYAPLTASKSATPGLLSEAADCYERTGDAMQASILRSRAQPVRSVEGKASSKPAAASPAAQPSAKE